MKYGPIIKSHNLIVYRYPEQLAFRVGINFIGVPTSAIDRFLSQLENGNEATHGVLSITACMPPHGLLVMIRGDQLPAIAVVQNRAKFLEMLKYGESAPDINDVNIGIMSSPPSTLPQPLDYQPITLILHGSKHLFQFPIC